MGTVMRKMHTGAEYFHYITSIESDRRTRLAFQDLVLRVAGPRAALFDFGAGPGIDARFFAERGFTVRAYDVDPQMCEFFAKYCTEFIDSGRIRLERGDYRDFLSRPVPVDAVDLIISNFAPLNLVPDLRELFCKFHALTSPNGKVLASVLNPYFRAELKSLTWWRRLPRLWREGCYFMPGPQAPHMRRRAANFRVLSAPYFKLTRIFSGLPAEGRRLGGSDAWFRRTASRFMFLLFEKCAAEAPVAQDPSS
jgi:SAM-dependent methyltransferase